MRDTKFYPDNYYHIYNRGVDKRKIYYTDSDRKRFLSKLIHCNNNSVRIICYALMENHYHLLIKETSSIGIPKLMGRVSNAYTKFFNAKYERSGRLFQSPYQAVQVETEAHLLHITRYIHLNPTAGKYDRLHKEKYRWTSLDHYLNVSTDSVLHTQEIMKNFSDTEDYQSFLSEWQPLGLKVK